MTEPKEANAEARTGSRTQKDSSGACDTKLHPGAHACETCGNEYDKTLEIVVNGISRYFDSFECAIHALAPRCSNCECRIIGHGLEAGGTMFCCAHCAQKKGVKSVKDRAN